MPLDLYHKNTCRTLKLTLAHLHIQRHTEIQIFLHLQYMHTNTHMLAPTADIDINTLLHMLTYSQSYSALKCKHEHTHIDTFPHTTAQIGTFSHLLRCSHINCYIIHTHT